MRDTGIVRRIDELGRVVIPKEIRKTLRIKEGDPLEIFTDKDELLFRKYSPLSTVAMYGEIMAECVSELTEKTCIITDTDCILCVTGGKYKDIVGKTLSGAMDKILKERKIVVTSFTDGDAIVPVFKGDELGSENQIISPIIGGGDCYGSIVVFDKETGVKFTPSDVKLVSLAAMFLGKQFE